MIGALPQLFGKNFLIGYALPATLIVLALIALADLDLGTGLYASFVVFMTKETDKLPLAKFGVLVLAIWSVAVLLVGVNYQLTRLLEGYGRFNPARLWRFHALRAFRDLGATMVAHDDARDRAYAVAAATRAANFPEAEDLVLPTRFGNILRAAERYPQIVYTMEPIQIWTRLQSVVPAPHLAAIDDAKAGLDFWVNLWFGALVLGAAEIALWAWRGHLAQPLLPLAALVAAPVLAKLAQAAALQYGMLIKATFDLFRGALCEQLGFEMPATAAGERALWEKVSQTLLYADPDVADGLAHYRRKTPPKKPDAKSD